MIEDVRYDEKSYWDARYKKNLHSGEGSRGVSLEFKTNAIREVLSLYDRPTVLDFGHGDGVLCFELTNDLSSYVGIDISEVAVSYCARYAAEIGLDNYQFIFGDIASIDIPQADVVMCMDVLFHMPSQNKFDTVVNKICRSFTKSAIISVWTDSIIKKVSGRFENHNNYYNLTIPNGFKITKTFTDPICDSKVHLVITKTETLR